MYKKFILASILTCPLTELAQCKKSWFEIKPSYFLFYTCPMKDIYNKGGFEIQGSVTLPCCNYFDIYGSVGYREAKGHALNSCEYTKLTVVPVDLGIKSMFKFWSRFYYYLALGPRYFCLHQYNNSPYVDSIITKSGIGLFANTGFNVILADCLIFGIFGECSYEKKTIYPKMQYVYSNGSTQIGGFAFGITLGYAF